MTKNMYILLYFQICVNKMYSILNLITNILYFEFSFYKYEDYLAVSAGRLENIEQVVYRNKNKISA